MPRFVQLVGLLAGLAGCDLPFAADDASAPESGLRFVRLSADAPPLAATVVSFYAVRGQDREVWIRYTDPLYGDGKCLRLRVPADALLRDASGRAFAPGDSVRITVRMDDPSVFRFQFEPAGLKFDPAHPAELEVRYRWADPDYNGDGVVDRRDQGIGESFGFWHQARAGERWRRIATTRQRDLQEARAQLLGFSQYALASE